MRSAMATTAVLLLVTGCSQSPYLDANLELMNAERRALEDRLYELEYEYEARVEELERSREDNARLRGRLGTDGEDLPTRRRSDDEASALDDFSPPDIDAGELSAPRIEIPDPKRGARARSDAGEEMAGPPLERAELDARVTHIDINRRHLAGVDFDDLPGDDGLAIVVEPRNRAGELVRLPGPISVVVLDYAMRGQSDSARVAQWDLTSTDVSRFLEDSPADEGIGLHLLWPDQAPEHARLRVDVRYFTVDGRHLDARRDVRVALPPRLSQRWTPRSTTAADGQWLASKPAGGPVPRSEPAAEPRETTSSELPEWKPFR